MSIKKTNEGHRIGLAEIADRLPAMIYQCVVELDGRCVFQFVNNAVQTYFDCSPAELYLDSTLILKSIYPKDKKQFKASIADAVRTLKAWQLEFRIVQSGKPVRWLSGQATCKKTSDKQTIWYGFFSDITESKYQLEKLNEAKEEAENVSLAKSQFLANMSREIRTPMNGIIGMTDLLLTSELGYKQVKYLTLIKNSTNSLLRLLDDLFDYSKVENNQVTIETKRFNVVKVIKEVTQQFGTITAQKGIEIKLLTDANSDQPLYGDVAKIRKVLLHLIDNAVKFTHEGKIEIKVSAIDLDASNLWLKLTIKDSGVGIPLQKQAFLFKHFSRQELNYTRQQHQGTGLGLPISRKLAELMQGEVCLKESSSDGSTFVFTLIVQKVGTVQKRETKTISKTELSQDNKIAPLSKQKKRVLIVEDDEASSFLLSCLLEKNNIDVVISNNGKEALTIHSNKELDLILMDIQMPLVDGITATKIIRERESSNTFKYTPIIGVTAYALREDKERFLAAGMDDYLAKPLDSRDVIAKINNWLNRNPNTLN